VSPAMTLATMTTSHEVSGLSRFGGFRVILLSARWAALVVMAVVILNFPALVHLVDVNPLGPLGHTASSVTDNLLPGLFYRDPDVGYTAQALGHRAALDWLHGIVPWWNPFEGLGSPLAAEMQSAAFFPPVLLFALSDSSLYFHMAMEVAAGLGTYFLCRELGFSRPVACVGGIMFEFSGTFAWLWHAPMNPVPLLPFCLLGIERIVRQPRWESGFVILALGLALSVYGGFPESTYLDLLLVIGWALLRLGLAHGDRARVAGRLVLASVTGLLLAMPLALAFVDYLNYAGTGSHSGGHAAHAHLTSAALPIVGMPYLYGSLDSYAVPRSPALAHFWSSVGGYVTASALAVALIGTMASRRDRALRLFLGAAFVVVLLWIFGVFPFDELSYLPYARHVGVFEYSAPIWELSAVVLACFGLESLGKDRRARLAAVVAAVVLLVYGALVLSVSPGRIVTDIRRVNPHGALYTDAILIWCAAIVVCIGVLGALRGGRGPRLAVGIILVLEASAACLVPELSAPRHETLDLGPATYLTDHLGLGRYYGFWYYHGDYGSYFGLASIDTSDNPVPKPWVDEAHRLGPNLLAYRFDGASVTGPPSTPYVALARLRTYEAIDVRYFLVRAGSGTYRLFEGSRRLRRVYDDGFIALFALQHPSQFFHTDGGTCHLTSTGYDQVTAECSKATTLVREELYSPGWAATANGKPTAVHEFHGLFSAVRLPAGRSAVTFSYAPPHIDDAVVAWAVGMLALFGLPLLKLVRRRRGASRMDEKA
jgi:hypothetical protein